VWLVNEAIVLQSCHVVSDCCRGYVEIVIHDDCIRTDWFRCIDEVFYDCF